MIRKLAWGTMSFLALLVALYSGAALFAPAVRNGLLQNLFATVPLLVGAHLAGGIVAILTGAFQVNSRLRARFLPAHRWTGRVYLVAVGIGGIAGLAMAYNSDGGLVAHVGFGSLAACWLVSTFNAYRYVLAGDVQAHRAWMLRSYALTLAAVTLRIYLPAFQIVGYSFDESYPLIAWIAWVPNLLVVEWLVLARPLRGAAGAKA